MKSHDKLNPGICDKFSIAYSGLNLFIGIASNIHDLNFNKNNIMKKILYIIAIAVTAISCASYKTTVDYDTSKDFTKYSSYHILKSKQDRGVNSLYYNRIQAQLSNNLKPRDYQNQYPQIYW